MDKDKLRIIAQRFFATVYRDEPIRPPAARVELPAPLRAARALEQSAGASWHAREIIFVRQGELLEKYTDDFDFQGQVTRYFPTYQSLSDPELRGYFAWRTKLRRGQMEKTSLSFAFLYIYELLNQIGVADPMDGYRKLLDFQDNYGRLDEGIAAYLRRWLPDYVVYYGLDSGLLADTDQVCYDRNIGILEDAASQPETAVIQAVKALAPKWLARSKFYSQYSTDCDSVIHAVLGRVIRHHAGNKRGFAEQYFGRRELFPIQMFDGAVFYDRRPSARREYALDSRCVYYCRNGFWSVQRHALPPRPNAKLNDLLKTIDAVMRQEYGYSHPIRLETDTKWLLRVIREETQALLARKKAEERRKLTIDYSQLAHIRQDAAATQDKLLVDDEREPEAPPQQPTIPAEPKPSAPAAPQPPAPAPQSAAVPEGLPLTPQEYRLVQCVLYGRNLSWVRQQGLMLSVLVDGVNEKLYDEFADSVLTLDDGLRCVEDYIGPLKEKVRP